MILPRRHFLAGLGALLAAPTIVRASSLMHVRALPIGTKASDFLTAQSAWFDQSARFYITAEDLAAAGQRIDEATPNGWVARHSALSDVWELYPVPC